MAAEAPAVLELEGVSRAFGGVPAVREVSLSVADGEVRGIIGPNGAGKSTLFNLITGHLAPDSGAITFRGRRIERRSPHLTAREGLSIVFQGARIFRGMSALENVMVGAHAWSRAGFLAGALRLPGVRREEREIRARAGEALERVGLGGWRDRSAESLPLGQQRALQVARAICARPLLLLLDEPASGLRAGEREALAALIESLRADRIAIMLVEHDVSLVGRLADRITVLDLGAVIAQGAPADVLADERVRSAYLGQPA